MIVVSRFLAFKDLALLVNWIFGSWKTRLTKNTMASFKLNCSWVSHARFERGQKETRVFLEETAVINPEL